MINWMRSVNDNFGVRRPLNVFLAYSKADLHYRQRLEVYLKPLVRQGRITIWHDGMLVGGDEWGPQIIEKLEEADLILFLLSPDLFATDFVEDREIPLALDRHRRGEATVIPLFLKNALSEGHPLLALQGFPGKDRPVEGGGQPVDDAIYEIARGLDDVIEVHWHKRLERTISAGAEETSTGRSLASVCLIAAAEDSHLKERLYKELFTFEHEGLFSISDPAAFTFDRSIAEKLQNSLETADLFVPLLTPNLLFNREFMDTMLPAILHMQRQKPLHVLPVLVSTCSWKMTPFFELAIILPSDQIPLLNAPSIDTAFTTVAENIADYVDSVIYET